LFGWVAAETALLTKNILPLMMFHCFFDFFTYQMLATGNALILIYAVRGSLMIVVAVYLLYKLKRGGLESPLPGLYPSDGRPRSWRVRHDRSRFPNTRPAGAQQDDAGWRLMPHYGTLVRRLSRLANLVLLCYRHHWMIHEGGGQLARVERGWLLAIPPSQTHRSWIRGPDVAVGA
jgi:hypothetical protein